MHVILHKSIIYAVNSCYKGARESKQTFSFQSSPDKWVNAYKFQLDIFAIKGGPLALSELLNFNAVVLKCDNIMSRMLASHVY